MPYFLVVLPFPVFPVQRTWETWTKSCVYVGTDVTMPVLVEPPVPTSAPARVQAPAPALAVTRAPAVPSGPSAARAPPAAAATSRSFDPASTLEALSANGQKRLSADGVLPDWAFDFLALCRVLDTLSLSRAFVLLDSLGDVHNADTLPQYPQLCSAICKTVAYAAKLTTARVVTRKDNPIPYVAGCPLAWLCAETPAVEFDDRGIVMERVVVSLAKVCNAVIQPLSSSADGLGMLANVRLIASTLFNCDRLVWSQGVFQSCEVVSRALLRCTAEILLKSGDRASAGERTPTSLVVDTIMGAWAVFHRWAASPGGQALCVDISLAVRTFLPFLASDGRILTLAGFVHGRLVAEGGLGQEAIFSRQVTDGAARGIAAAQQVVIPFTGLMGEVPLYASPATPRQLSLLWACRLLCAGADPSGVDVSVPEEGALARATRRVASVVGDTLGFGSYVDPEEWVQAFLASPVLDVVGVGMASLTEECLARVASFLLACDHPPGGSLGGGQESVVEGAALALGGLVAQAYALVRVACALRVGALSGGLSMRELWWSCDPEVGESKPSYGWRYALAFCSVALRHLRAHLEVVRASPLGISPALNCATAVVDVMDLVQHTTYWGAHFARGVARAVADFVSVCHNQAPWVGLLTRLVRRFGIVVADCVLPAAVGLYNMVCDESGYGATEVVEGGPAPDAGSPGLYSYQWPLPVETVQDGPVLLVDLLMAVGQEGWEFPGAGPNFRVTVLNLASVCTAVRQLVELVLSGRHHGWVAFVPTVDVYRVTAGAVRVMTALVMCAHADRVAVHWPTWTGAVVSVFKYASGFVEAAGSARVYAGSVVEALQWLRFAAASHELLPRVPFLTDFTVFDGSQDIAMPLSMEAARSAFVSLCTRPPRTGEAYLAGAVGVMYELAQCVEAYVRVDTAAWAASLPDVRVDPDGVMARCYPIDRGAKTSEREDFPEFNSGGVGIRVGGRKDRGQGFPVSFVLQPAQGAGVSDQHLVPKVLLYAGAVMDVVLHTLRGLAWGETGLHVSDAFYQDLSRVVEVFCRVCPRDFWSVGVAHSWFGCIRGVLSLVECTMQHVVLGSLSHDARLALGRLRQFWLPYADEALSAGLAEEADRTRRLPVVGGEVGSMLSDCRHIDVERYQIFKGLMCSTNPAGLQLRPELGSIAAEAKGVLRRCARLLFRVGDEQPPLEARVVQEIVRVRGLDSEVPRGRAVDRGRGASSVQDQEHVGGDSRGSAQDGDGGRGSGARGRSSVRGRSSARDQEPDRDRDRDRDRDFDRGRSSARGRSVARDPGQNWDRGRSSGRDFGPADGRQLGRGRSSARDEDGSRGRSRGRSSGRELGASSARDWDSGRGSVRGRSSARDEEGPIWDRPRGRSSGRDLDTISDHRRGRSRDQSSDSDTDGGSERDNDSRQSGDVPTGVQTPGVAECAFYDMGDEDVDYDDI